MEEAWKEGRKNGKDVHRNRLYLTFQPIVSSISFISYFFTEEERQLLFIFLSFSQSLLAACPRANCLRDVKLLHLFSKDCFFSAYTVPNCQIKEINNNFILFFVCPHPSVIEFKILRECFKEKRLQKFFRDLYVIVIGSKRTINEHKMQEKQPSARSEFVL